MYSNSMRLAPSYCAPLAAAIFLAALGCGRVQESAVTPQPSATSTVPTPSTEITFIVENERGQFEGGDIGLIALNFSSQHRAYPQGVNPYPDEPHPQIDTLHSVPSNARPCSRENEEVYLTAAGDIHPVDTGYVGTMRIDMRNSVYAPDDRLALCFAVHTRSNGWQWHWEPVPIVIDFGVHDFGSGPGGGHFDLVIKTADVDQVLLMPSIGDPSTLSKITYTAIPAGH